MTQDHPIQKLKNFFHLLQSVQANIRYGFPARKLKIIGVTGTDGKTTTTAMIYHILKQSGLKVGYISTIDAKIGDKNLDTGLHVTTPDPWVIPRYLREMHKAGMEYVVIESTSSGLEQNRLWGVRFDSATITNIKNDHLDYHGTWENYAESKFKLIEMIAGQGVGILNRDDDRSASWIKKRLGSSGRPEVDIVWYSKSDVSNLEESVGGIGFDYDKMHYNIPVIGEYNVENALAAINVTQKYLSPEKIASALRTFPVPKGRMQVVKNNPFSVIVDFAHTSSSLERALSAVNKIKSPGGRTICVFGCAGKRDKARRSMGEVSARLADVTVLTSEDPRDEKLGDINDEIFDYARKHKGKMIQRISDHKKYLGKAMQAESHEKQIDNLLAAGEKPFFAFDEDSINSRQDAIDFAIQIAKPDDIVFITGKAHEQSMAFGDTEYPWSDHEAVKRALDKSK
ncbi:MAG: Mur ligase family protein [Candidatus Dojkabacteria bacterium]